MTIQKGFQLPYCLLHSAWSRVHYHSGQLINMSPPPFSGILEQRCRSARCPIRTLPLLSTPTLLAQHGHRDSLLRLLLHRRRCSGVELTLHFFFFYCAVVSPTRWGWREEKASTYPDIYSMLQPFLSPACHTSPRLPCPQGSTKVKKVTWEAGNEMGKQLLISEPEDPLGNSPPGQQAMLLQDHAAGGLCGEGWEAWGLP